MKCPRCQTDNPDGSKFCKECATSLTGAEEENHRNPQGRADHRLYLCRALSDHRRTWQGGHGEGL